jgi:peptide/nickel transport system substrate-binding protein
MTNAHEIDRRQLLAGAATLALGAAGLGYLAGCGGEKTAPVSGPGAAGPPKPGGTLRVGALGTRSAIERDPHGVLANESDFLIASLVFEALTIPGRQQVAPRLASSWEPNDNLTRWTFTIDDGARFHDGTPVTADDVVWSLKRLRATDARVSRLPGIAPSGIRKATDRSVLLVSDAPNAELPTLLRLNTFVLPQGTKKPERAAGSGPFKLASYADGNAVLTRNDSWHGGKVLLDEIQVTMFQDVSAMASAVLGGQIDVASNVGPVAARSAKGNAGVRVIRRPNDVSLPIVMRIADGPFADVRVRQALRLAVDRQAMVTGALSGFGTIANDVMGVADPSYAKDLPQRQRDLAKATKLLVDAKFDLTQTHELVTTADIPGLAESAVLFATQMKDVGVRMKVVKQDSAAFYDTTWLKAPLYTTYWGTNDSVAFFLSKTMISTTGFNESAWKSKQLDGLYARAVGATDEAARKTALHDAQRLQYEQGGYVLWGMADGLDIARPAIRDLPTLPGYGRVFLERVWLDA